MPELDRPLRVLLVDDHEIVRRGLAALLARRPRFEVVGEAGTSAEALQLARMVSPDIILMDLRLPDASGIEACRMVRDEFPGMAVVFLTSSPAEADVFSAIVAGARGYMLKQTPTAQLLRALEAVGRGESLLDPTVTGMVMDRIRRVASKSDADAIRLTVREREILTHLVEGRTNGEIAAAVFLSTSTVKNYVSSILAKLSLDRRAQISAYMTEHDHLLE